MHICVLCVCLLHSMVGRDMEDSMENGIMGGYKLPCGIRELSPGPLQEQPGFLVVDLSLHLHL